MKKVGYVQRSFPVLGMDCASCVLVIEKKLEEIEGVEEAKANYVLGEVSVTYNPEKVLVFRIEEVIERLGYRIAYKKYPSIKDKLSRIFGKKGPAEELVLQNLRDHEFKELVSRSEKPFAVVFTSPTCPSCKAFKPVLKRAYEKFEDGVELYEIDVSETTVWKKYGIVGVPTLISFKGGRETGRQMGYLEQEEIEKIFSALLQR